MLIRRPRPASAAAAQTGIFIGRGGGTELSRNTYNMGLDSEPIKLLLVITPGFSRVIGDEEDAFLYKKRRIGSSG